MLHTFVGHLRRVVGDPRNEASFVLFGLVAVLVVRAFVEVDVINPYVVGSFLLFYAAGRLASPRAARRHAAAAAHRPSQPGHAA
jgi:exopolysaccharide production protein ExoQ